MEKKQKLHLIFELALLILFFILFPFVRKDILAFSFYTVVYFYIITMKTESIVSLGLSTLIALIWVNIAKDFYIYDATLVKILGIHIYPLLAWAIGLFGAKELFSYIKIKNNVISFISFTLVYMTVLILVETISFHIIGFKNNGNYAGLPICDCIHVPVFMQIYYLTIGPIFLLITRAIDKITPNQH